MCVPRGVGLLLGPLQPLLDVLPRLAPADSPNALDILVSLQLTAFRLLNCLQTLYRCFHCLFSRLLSMHCTSAQLFVDSLMKILIANKFTATLKVVTIAARG